MKVTTITVQFMTPEDVKVSGNLLEGQGGKALADGLLAALNGKARKVVVLPLQGFSMVEGNRNKRRTRKASTKAA